MTIPSKHHHQYNFPKTLLSQCHLSAQKTFRDFTIERNKPNSLTQNSTSFLLSPINLCKSFPGGSDGKASACNAGDPGSIPGLGQSPGEGKGNPLQYSCLENPADGGACQATVHGVAESDMTEQLYLLYLLNGLVVCSTFFSLRKLQETVKYRKSGVLQFMPLPSFSLSAADKCSVVSNSLQPKDCSLSGSSVHGIFPGKNIVVGCHSLLQGIFPTQGSNSCLLHLLR